MLEALGGLVGACVRGGFGGGCNVVLLWRVKKPHSNACPRQCARGLRAEVDRYGILACALRRWQQRGSRLGVGQESA